MAQKREFEKKAAGKAGLEQKGPSKEEPREKEFGKQGFRYPRVIRFQETDAAGVVYFANLLSLCHEAFEASLAESGIGLATFFSKENGVAVPIVHTEADFHRPLRCGDNIEIHLKAVQLKPHSFEIHYKIDYSNANEETDGSRRSIATALTTHVCIDITTQRIRDLSVELLAWLETVGTPIEKGLTPSAPND